MSDTSWGRGRAQLSTPMADIREFDAMMDEWERLIIKGQHGAALTMVENAIADVPSLPPLYELQRRVHAHRIT